MVGLGNPLMGDDGFGLAVLERFRDGWTAPATELVDGGTWGMQLLPLLEDAERVLFLDAIDQGAPAGTPIRLERDELPRRLSQKLSPHQVDLREVLAVMELRGTLPREVVALGVQPARVALGTELSPPLAALVEATAARAAAQLVAWGCSCAAREGACTS